MSSESQGLLPGTNIVAKGEEITVSVANLTAAEKAFIRNFIDLMTNPTHDAHRHAFEDGKTAIFWHTGGGLDTFRINRGGAK